MHLFQHELEDVLLAAEIPQNGKPSCRDQDGAELIGEHTIGRAASQKLVRLPDGAGLWLSTTHYLTPKGDPLHEKGLAPTVPVDDPDIEFGAPAPTTDPVLEKAIERLSEKKAA